MVRLYVIGNGFDLIHKLPTSWEDFIYSSAGALWNSNIFEDPDDPEHPWADLESNLGKPNVEEICEQLKENYEQTISTMDTDSGGNVSPFNLNLSSSLDIGPDVYDQIAENVKEWISSVSLEGVRPIPKWPLPSDLFITFNYTMLLEEVYGVKKNQICHIHGSVKSAKIIVGHGSDVEVRGLSQIEGSEYDPYPNQPDISQREVEAELRDIAEDVGLRLIEVTKKNIDSGFDNLDDFLKRISGKQVKEIIVIGHSLGDVDKPYINKLALAYPQAQWTVTYHGDKCRKEDNNRKSEMCSRAKANGIPLKGLTIIRSKQYFDSL
ncbi:bacteriophage abortive infection AbiH family protein [Bifidobacterium asteroides]|uniref:bacteriophage abortive infection AbiH family protein n=1 Tax=Bifidobacterium asteroides TaxID=1684 RepID=UPI002740A363|nr:bacteriophage abortive infection AbiH family protein [Bifidobacterium asteroides]WLT10728.1 bacteriophage abortive infection AbiH family protein [Bifidobacterium asteroides]